MFCVYTLGVLGFLSEQCIVNLRDAFYRNEMSDMPIPNVIDFFICFIAALSTLKKKKRKIFLCEFLNFTFIVKPFIKTHTAGCTPGWQAEALEKGTEAAQISTQIP